MPRLRPKSRAKFTKVHAPASGVHVRTTSDPSSDRAMDEYEEAVLFTYSLLESRLDRLEYILGGAKKGAEEKPKTVPERMQKIEKSLQELSAKTALLNDAQQLCMSWTWSLASN